MYGLLFAQIPPEAGTEAPRETSPYAIPAKAVIQPTNSIAVRARRPRKNQGPLPNGCVSPKVIQIFLAAYQMS
jgi:hypothetical protein